MVKRVYINGKRTNIEIRDEHESTGSGGGGGDMPWPLAVAILGLFVWFLSLGHWAVLRIIWLMLKVGFFCMGGFLFMDVDHLF